MRRCGCVRPRLGILPSLAAALVTLAGCGSVSWDSGKVESTIHDVLTKQAHVQVKSVSCPSKAKIAKGVVTYCEATLLFNEVRPNPFVTRGRGDGFSHAETHAERKQL